MIETIVGRYLQDLDALMRQIVATHLIDELGYGLMLRYAMGWVDEHDKVYDRATGKRLRPTLLLLCNEAANGDWHIALPAAAAVELLHNFSLIHDDIQDVSDIRHGRPTVWRIWGKANAINAGDTLFTLAYITLQQLTGHIPDAEVLRVWQIFNQTNMELTRGQHLDMRFEMQNSVSVDAYISMIKGKTAALLAACAQLGAFIATGDEAIAQYYHDFGLNLGIAFQVHDDILGIWGDSDITGKSAATDIVSRKKSLPVLYGLQKSKRLTAVYSQKVFGDDEVREAVRLLDEVGAQTYAREQETAYYEKAMTALEAAQARGEAATLLRDFVDFLFKRNY